MNKKKKLFNIGIDLDDTIWDYQSLFFKFYNDKFGTSHDPKFLFSYSLEDFFELSREKARNLLDEFAMHKDFRCLPLLDGAKEAIEKLRKNHNLFFITARPPKRKNPTKECFFNHFGYFGKIYFLGEEPFSHFKTKGKICKNLGIHFMIDDNLENLRSCKEEGIKSFLIDKPWNRGKKIEGIKRVKNWEEILNLIEKNEN